MKRIISSMLRCCLLAAVLACQVFAAAPVVKLTAGAAQAKPGDTVTITYVRDGQVATTELTFGSTTDASTTSTETTIQPEADSGRGTYPYGGDMDEFFEQFFGTSYSSGKAA